MTASKGATGARPSASAGIAGLTKVLGRSLLRPELSALGGCIVAFVVFTVATPLFISQDTFVPATSLAAQYGIVAVGVTLLMIGGQFDLSVGAIVGLTGWSMYFFGQELGLPPEITILLALAFGTALGFINGFIVVRTGLASFIVTLATQMVYRGLLTMQTAGMPIVIRFPTQYSQLLSGTELGGYRMSLLWFLVATLIATWFLLRTQTGNWVFSIGQNPQAARNLGVPVERTTLLLFCISGFTSALAGVILATQYASIDAGRGAGWELYAIAITVIGGTLLTGGYGSVVGTVFGAVFYAIVQGGLILMGIQGYWVDTLFGAVLIGAVLVNRLIVTRVMTAPETAIAESGGAAGESLPPPSPGAEVAS